MARISPADLQVMSRTPNGPNAWFSELTENDRDAYRRVHFALSDLGQRAATRMGNGCRHVLTAGFNPDSGVRGYRPKDLWVALVNEGSKEFVGMPQIYAIASESGIEIGFAAAIHRSNFSDQSVKQKLKASIPALFDIFPDVEDPIIEELNNSLSLTAGWRIRDKTRLDGSKSEFASIELLLRDLKSDIGRDRGSGAISQYFTINDITQNTFDMDQIFADAVSIFSPLMKLIKGRYKLAGVFSDIQKQLVDAGGSIPSVVDFKFEPESIEDARVSSIRAIKQRQGQNAFRASLVAAYEGKCAISRTDAIYVLEGAHIVPYKGSATNHVSNGILLRTDLHTLFDLGLIGIDRDYLVFVSPLIDSPHYRVFHGTKIWLPNNAFHRPSPEALAWRQTHIKQVR